MNNIDARTLPNAAIEEKRRQAVKLRKNGMTLKEIAPLVGVHHDTVGRWIRAYAAEGSKALSPKRRGLSEGDSRTMSAEQEARIKTLLADKTPDQLKMPYALWTRKSVKELIKHETGITLAIRTVGTYLKRWGMTPQKPKKQAYEQQPERVKQWLDEAYPAIQKQAKREDAEIFWGDETAMRSDCQHERGYAPKGQTPVVRINAKRHSLNMISAITNQGKVRFQLFEGGMNADLLIGFLKRLLKDAKRKVILILDNMRVHHARKVKEWLEGKEEDIEIFYLPAYSPELNPDEYLNCDLKCGVHSGKPARSKADLKSKVRSHMKMLQRRPHRVRKYFEHEKICYAA